MVDMKTQGDSLFDIVDKRDHGTVQAQLLHGVGKADGQHKRAISFFCRMKMSRTLKRQGGFGDVKVMHVKGHIVPVAQKESGSAEPNIFMALCTPLITPDVKESLIQNNTTVFKSVHKLDMSFIEISETGEFHFGMTTKQIQNQSWYSMIHPEDLTEARAKHVQLIKSRQEMGCMLTVRMFTDDKIIWLNIVMHLKQALVSNSEDPFIICINQVVSEEEAKQFRMQGQLLAFYSSRAPDMFLGAHNLHVDAGIIGCQQAEVYVQKQQAFFAEQQRYQYAPSVTEPTCYPSSQNQYSLPSMELVCQQPQGRTSTIRALKRKLQENFISSCKPSKVPRVISGDMQDDVSIAESQHLGDSHYVMDVNVFKSTSGVNQTMNGNDTGSLPCVYQTAANDLLQTRKQQRLTTMTNSIAPVADTPVVVQKLNPTCSLEQVVPDVSIPDCYLTPDASPASSPKPTTTASMKHDTHEISRLITCITDRLNEFKQSQVIYEDAVAVKSNDKNAMQKLLPVIDAIFVDSFFDGFKTMSEDECMDFKFESISPTPTVQFTQQQQLEKDVRVSLPDAITTIGRSQPHEPSMHNNALCIIKDDLSLEDCADLDTLLEYVDTACLNDSMLSPESIADVLSPAASPESASNGFSGYSPVSPQFDCSQSYVKHSLNVEVNPGSNLPVYDGLEDLLDPNNWLQEPFSISMDMPLPDFDISPCDVKATCQDQDLYYLKELLQRSWEPRGIPSYNLRQSAQ